MAIVLEESTALKYDSLINTKGTDAYLIVFGNRRVWIPKSMCILYPEDYVVVASMWLVTLKGLACYELTHELLPVPAKQYVASKSSSTAS